jgi:Bacterial membrane protein YfhO
VGAYPLVMTDPGAKVGISGGARRHGAAVTLLVAVTALFFSALFEGRTYSDVSRYQRIAYPWGAPGAPPLDEHLIHYDQAESYYPWQVFMTRAYREGEVPLWNPYAFAGTPFLAANANNALYPPRIALSRTSLSPTRVHDVFVAVHMFLAGVAMYLLLAYFRTSFAGALLGAVSWMAGSFMLAWIALEHFVVVAALLPVAVLLADASIRQRSWPAALALGPVLALLFLGGNVLFVELCFAAVGGYAAALVLARIVRAARPREHGARPRGVVGDVARFAVPWLLFAGLAAVTLLPTAELVRSMGRTPLTYSELKGYALPKSELVRLFSPPSARWYETYHHDAYHVALFGGTAVALLALLGLAARRPGAWFARVLAAVALLVALASPMLALPYVLLPGFDNFKPLGRVLFLVAFGLAMLAAFGLDTLGRLAQRALGEQRGAMTLGVVGFVAIAATVVQLRVYSPVVMHDQEPTVTQTYPATPLVELLRRDEGARVIPVGRVLPGSTALVYPLRSAGGYESIVPGRVQDFWRVVAGLPADRLSEPLPSSFEPIPEFGTLRSDLLWRAAIGYVAAPPAGIDADPTPEDSARLEVVYEGEDGRVFLVRDALPRAYVVGTCVEERDSRSALMRFQETAFDPRRSVVVEEGRLRDAGLTCSPEQASVSGSAQVVEESLNTLTLEVDATAPGFLVVNETWDPGWHAEVDGKAAPVLPANSLFRAIPVRAGRQTVELRYRPRSYEVGLWVSGGTSLVLLAILGAFVARRPARRRAGALESAHAAGMTSKRPGASP